MVIQDTDVCVLSCARTPIGSFGGKLKSFSATQLGSLAIKEALARCSANVVHHVDEVYATLHSTHPPHHCRHHPNNQGHWCVSV